MNHKVHLTQKAFTYPNRDIEHIIKTIESLSNSKQLAAVCELVDIHTRTQSRNTLKIQRMLFGTRCKPYVFISCLN